MPWATAVLTTSTATVADTSRSREMSGSRPFGRVARIGELGQGASRSDEQGRRHGRSSADDDAQTEAGEHQRIVGLADPVRGSVEVDRLERATGSDERCSVGPGEQVGRSLFGQHGRVGHRQDDRARTVLVHRADDVLVESPGDA